MIPRPLEDYPDRDITPEHTKRETQDHEPIHPCIDAAYDYVVSILDTSDYTGVYAWHGWALREAFLAGVSYAEKREEE